MKVKNPITYYNRNGIFMVGLFGIGVRAKNTAIATYTGNGANRIGRWVFVFGRVS